MEGLTLGRRTFALLPALLFANPFGGCALAPPDGPMAGATKRSPLSYQLRCQELVLESGSMGQGQSAAALAEGGLTGTADRWERYVEFAGGSSATCHFVLPERVTASRITRLALGLNYRGPRKSDMLWLFEAYDSAQDAWVGIVDNGFARDWRWTQGEVELPGDLDRFVLGSTVRIRYRTDLTHDASLLDQWVLRVSVADAPPTEQVVHIDSDGASGRDAYAILRDALGPKPYECPDADHDFKHIKEDGDAEVGYHFVLYLHRDVDGDPAGGTDRQRNEIKVYEGSDDRLKGFEGTTFTYRWKLKVDREMKVSKGFTHLFQLKGVGGDADHPLITLTSAKVGGEDRLQVRYSPSSKDIILDETMLSSARGIWLEVFLKATFATDGHLTMSVRGPDGTALLSVDEPLDMWRDGDFVRPKWGLYRSLVDEDDLRVTEILRLAHLSISWGE